MAGTYKATGINLKGMPLGESDRLLTVLTKEFGLIRLVAPSARKHQSSLRGRSGLFVVNELLIAKGRSLDKIVQAESLESYPGLSQDLKKLTASQYVAELVLYQALSDQPQEDLFSLLNEHLRRLEQIPAAFVLPSLVHATFHLLALAGIAPQVHTCCFTQEPLEPNFTNLDWRVGFNAAAGGTVNLAELERVTKGELSVKGSTSLLVSARPHAKQHSKVVERAATYPKKATRSSMEFSAQLDATQLALLQLLAQPNLIQANGAFLQPPQQLLSQLSSDQAWLSIERILRQYAQYHFEQPIRSASLIDTCFPLPSPL